MRNRGRGWLPVLAALLVLLAFARPGFAQGQTGGEVDLDSGRLFLGEADWSQPAGPLRLELVRILQSPGRAPGLPGPGWRLTWEQRLEVLGELALVERAGGPLILTKDEDGAGFGSDHGHRLTVEADGGAELRPPEGGLERFDAEGRLVAASDRNGNTLTFTYDTEGRLAQVAGPQDSVAMLAYDEAGLLTEVSFSGGRTIAYRYEEGRLAEVLSDGQPWAAYGYDEAGALNRIEAPGGQSVAFAYDDGGRVTRRDWADGAFETFAYDDARNQVTHVDAGGALTTIAWNEDRSVKRVTNNAGQTSEFRYDEAGRLTQMTEPDGRVSKTVYDELGRAVSLDDGSGVERRISYVGDTRLIESVETSDGHVEVYSYDENWNLLGVSQNGEASSSFEYGPEGELLAAELGEGERRELTYDEAGRIATLRLGDAPPTRFEYDEAGNLVRQTDALGGVIAMAYDAEKRLIASTDQSGATTRYEYDEAGRRSAVIDALGGVSRYRYDGQGRLVETVDPLGRVQRTDFAPSQDLVVTSYPDGLVEELRYDVEGRLVEHVDAAGLSTRYVYDQEGRLTEERRPGDHRIGYRYDSDGGLEAVEDSRLGTTRYERDEAGLLLAMTGPDGKTVRYVYDEAGRVTEERHDNGATVAYAYTESGQVAEISASTGGLTTFTYDEEGRVLTRDENGETTSFVYGPLGRVESETHSTLGTTHYGYDAVGNLVEQALPDGRVYRYEYDELGRRTAAIDPLGRTTRTAYDGIGNVTAIVSPSGEETRYIYDDLGRLSEVEHPANGPTAFVRDGLGRIVETVDSRGNRSAKTYDDFGSVTASRDEAGGEVVFAYDDRQRLQELRWPDGRSTRYSYTDQGSLAAIEDSHYPLAYAYDEEGRLTEVRHPKIERAVTYSYDEEGRPRTLATGPETELAYRYDEAGRLGAIVLPDGAELSFTYDDRNRLSALRYPNGVTGRWTFDASGRVATVAYVGPDGQDLAVLSVRYDDADFPTEVREAEGDSWAFGYDADGRLVSEQRGAASVAYAYAPGGNRASLAGGQGETVFSYDKAGRLLKAGETVFDYDATGSLVRRKGPAGIDHFTYDAQGKLARVESAEGTVLAFGYGPTGKRIWREGPAGRSQFLYDGQNLIEELDEDGSTRAFYVHGLGIDWPLAMLRDGRFAFFHNDSLGNVILVTDETGAALATYDYDAFGNLLERSGDFESPFLFAGRPFEASVGLYDFRNRYYDPAIGRFISADPFPAALEDPASFNRYTYARNAPTRYRDPLGLYDINYRHWSRYGITPDQIHAMVDSTMELLNRIPETFSDSRDNSYSQHRPGPASQAILDEAKGLVEAELQRAEMGPSRNRTGPRLRARARAAINDMIGPPRRPPPPPPPPNSEPSRMAVPRTEPTGNRTQVRPQGTRHTDIYRPPPPDQFQIPPPEPEPVRGPTRQQTAIYEPVTEVQGRTPAGPTRAAGAVAPEPNPTVRATPRAPRGTTLRPTVQQGATPPEPGASTGLRGAATRGVGAAGVGMTGIAVYQHYQACIEEGGDPESCEAQARNSALLAGGILVGGTIIAATSATVAGILASPVLVAAGTLAAGVAAADATARRAGAPSLGATRAQQEQAAINRRDKEEVIAQIDGHLRAEIDALKALPAQIEQQELAALGPVAAFEAAFDSVRQARGRLRDARAQLEAVNQICAGITAVDEQMSGMLGDAAGYERMVQIGLDVAQQVADNCPDVANPDNITAAYNQAEGALGRLGGVRGEMNGLNAQVANNGDGARELLATVRAEGAGLAEEVLSLGRTAEGLRDTINTDTLEQVRAVAGLRSDFETRKAGLHNKIDNFFVATELDDFGPVGAYREEVRAIYLRPDRLGGWASIRDEVENDYRRLLGVETEAFDVRDQAAAAGCELEVARAQTAANDVEFMFLNAALLLSEKQHLATAAESCVPPEQVAEAPPEETGEETGDETGEDTGEETGGEDETQVADTGSDAESGGEEESCDVLDIDSPCYDPVAAAAAEAAAAEEETAGEETASEDVPCDVLDVNSPCYDPEEAAAQEVRDAPDCDESDPMSDCYSPWWDANAPGNVGSEEGDTAGAMAAGEDFGGGLPEDSDMDGGDDLGQVAAIPQDEINPTPDGTESDTSGTSATAPSQPLDDDGISDMGEPDSFMPQPDPIEEPVLTEQECKQQGPTCHIRPGTNLCHCPDQPEAGGQQSAGAAPEAGADAAGDTGGATGGTSADGTATGGGTASAGGTASGGGAAGGDPFEACRSRGWRVVSLLFHATEEDEAGNRIIVDANETLNAMSRGQAAVMANYAPPGFSLGRLRLVQQRLSLSGAIQTARNSCNPPDMDALFGPGTGRSAPPSGGTIEPRADGRYSCCSVVGQTISQEGQWFVYEQRFQAQ